MAARLLLATLLGAPAAGHVVLQDVNLVVTTDLHAWIEGREHEPHLNATLGHAISFLEHLKTAGQDAKKDVFFFDNGDINDGTGLSASASDHVTYLAPLMQQAPYDALNCGNHELYSRNAGGAVGGVECPIVGLRDSGYIARWQGRYLSSNIVWSGTKESIGQRFRVVEGEFGTQLLVFGFLYNMPDHCDAVDVENVSEVLGADWFLGALKDHGARSDAIVVLFHIDYRDELIDSMLDAIRRSVGPKKPVQVLAGHSHIRGWRRLDGFASSYEPGCKLDTVGFTSFNKRADASGHIVFGHQDLDGNTAVIAEAANVTEGALLTAEGREFNQGLAAVRNSVGLDTTLGCSSKHYSVRAALSEADSLWTYYMGTVLPSALFQRDGPRPQWSILGTGALSYDVYTGPFTKDDAYKVSPFGNFWFSMRGIQGAKLSELAKNLNSRGGPPAGRRLSVAGWSVPEYVVSSTPDAATSYDIIYCDFDAGAVEAELAKLLGHAPPQREVYRHGSNTSSVLVDWFRTQPCPAGEPAARGPAIVV